MLSSVARHAFSNLGFGATPLSRLPAFGRACGSLRFILAVRITLPHRREAPERSGCKRLRHPQNDSPARSPVLRRKGLATCSFVYPRAGVSPVLFVKRIDTRF